MTISGKQLLLKMVGMGYWYNEFSNLKPGYTVRLEDEGFNLE